MRDRTGLSVRRYRDGAVVADMALTVQIVLPRLVEGYRETVARRDVLVDARARDCHRVRVIPVVGEDDLLARRGLNGIWLKDVVTDIHFDLVRCAVFNVFAGFIRFTC